MSDRDFDMNKQHIIHAYKDGAYQGGQMDLLTPTVHAGGYK